jgi:TonB family protein
MEVNRESSSAITATTVVLCLIGLLNVILGIAAVISGAFPSAEGKPVAPPIGVGSIFFGLVLLAAGAFWILAGIGYLMRREWGTPLALYIAPVIGVVNVIGVLGLWGFTVSIGWAALSAVAAMAGIWYLSRKELASFFLIAVAEHAIIVVVFAMLIYAEPVAESQDAGLMLVSMEETEPPEPVPLEVIPEERATLKPPIMPKIEIGQDIAATDPGPEIEDVSLPVPKTAARITAGADTILRPYERRDRDRDTVPTVDANSVLDSSEKPVLEIGSSGMTKDTGELIIARPPDSLRDDSAPPDERVGPSDEVARPSFAGDITGEIAGRRVVFWPKPPEEYKGTGGGSATVKFWVDPAGSVIRVEISKKAGSPNLDTMATEYVKEIRFVALPGNVQHRNQWGTIVIDFELTRKNG